MTKKSENLGTGVLMEFTNFGDVILRIFTDRGSSPIIIVDGGKVQTPAAIGSAILGLFDHTVSSEVFQGANERPDVAESKVYFSVPNGYTIGSVFDSWEDARCHAVAQIEELSFGLGLPPRKTRSFVDTRIKDHSGDRLLVRLEVFA